MRTLPTDNPKVKAFYAHLYDQAGILTKSCVMPLALAMGR